MKHYCPRNGCGMPNGAAPPCPVICSKCGFGTYEQPYTFTNFDKICPKCKTCSSCKRIAKKFFKIVNIEDLRSALEVIDNFNKLNLWDIELHEKGQAITITQKCLEEWRFVGMSNISFIESEFWNSLVD